MPIVEMLLYVMVSMGSPCRPKRARIVQVAGIQTNSNNRHANNVQQGKGVVPVLQNVCKILAHVKVVQKLLAQLAYNTIALGVRVAMKLINMLMAMAIVNTFKVRTAKTA